MNIAIFIAGYFIQYAFNVYLAHHFTPEYYGEFSMAYRILLLGATLTLLGTGSSLFRFFSPLQKNNDTRSMKHFLRWNLLFVGKAFVICLGIAVILILSLYGLHKLGLKDFNSYHLAVYTLFLVPLCALFYLISTYMISFGRSKLSSFLRICFLFLFMMFCFYLALDYLQLPVTNWLVIIILAISIFVVLVCEIFSIRRQIGPLIIDVIKLKAANSLVIDPQWSKVSFKLIFTTVTYLCTMVIQLSMIEFFLESKYTGIFSAIILIASILFYIPMGAYLSIKKDIVSSMKTTKDKLVLVSQLKTINNIYLFISLLLVFLIIFFGKIILSHFGPTYVQGYPELFIMSIAQFFYSASTSPTLFLAYCGEEKYILYLNVLMLICLAVLCAVLCYFIGFIGIAIGTLTIFLIKLVLCLHRVNKKFGIKALTYL